MVSRSVLSLVVEWTSIARAEFQSLSFPGPRRPNPSQTITGGLEAVTLDKTWPLFLGHRCQKVRGSSTMGLLDLEQTRGGGARSFQKGSPRSVSSFWRGFWLFGVVCLAFSALGGFGMGCVKLLFGWLACWFALGVDCVAGRVGGVKFLVQFLVCFSSWFGLGYPLQNDGTDLGAHFWKG